MGSDHGVRTQRQPASLATDAPSDADLRAALAEAIQRVGVGRVCSRVPISAETALRVVTGERVRRGSLALLATHFGVLTELRAAP